MKYIASVSLGKDSLAMVLKLLELGYPLDEIIFFSTGADFNCILKNAEKLRKLCEEKKIQFTILEPEQPFFFLMTEKPVKKRDGSEQKGYKWCGGPCRWGTRLKLDAIEKHYKQKYGSEETIIEYIGIANDEKERINRERQKRVVKLYPLVEWGMNEADCLNFCRQRGWNWIEEENTPDMYDILDRISCFCCGNKNIKELRQIYKYLPDTWQKLKDLQKKIDKPFRQEKTIFDFEERFKNEEAQLSFLELLNSPVD